MGSAQSPPSGRPGKLILGTAIGYSHQDIAPFLTSLDSVYSGHLVLLVAPDFEMPDGTPRTFSLELVRVGSYVNDPLHGQGNSVADIIPSRLRWRNIVAGPPTTAVRTLSSAQTKDWWLREYHIQTARFAFYYHYLLNHATAKVMLTDVRDVVFQRDPFDSIHEGLYVFKESATVTIGEQWHNSFWIKRAFGWGPFWRLKDQNILCSGTILGDAASTSAFLRSYLDLIVACRVAPRIKGIDQGVFNYWVHRKRLDDHTFHVCENNSIVFTAGLASSAVPVNTEEGIALDGVVPAILHQYDRHPRLLDAVRIRLDREEQTHGVRHR